MIFKNNLLRIAFRQILPIGILLAGVSSCSVSHSMAGETDGIYFDPETDQSPVYVSAYEGESYYSPDNDETLVRIGGKYFDKDGNAPVIEKQKSIYETKNPRKSYYPEWGEESSDVNVSVNYFGSPFYSGFGWGVSYGWGSPYYRYRYSPYYSPYFGSSLYWGWNSPYYGYSPYYNVWDPFYDPYYYNPYYYNPYRRGYYGYGGYNPYYGSYYPGYYRNVRPIERGKGMNSNVTISRGSNANYRADDSGKVRIRRYDDRTINRGNSYSAERTRTPRRAETDYNRSSRIRYDRSSSSDSWSSSRSSSWGNSNSRSYTPSSSNRSSGGTVRFK